MVDLPGFDAEGVGPSGPEEEEVSQPDFDPSPYEKERRLWDRLPNESDRAYGAFMVYAELGPNERSLKLTAEKLGKSTQLMSRWSAEYSWVDRARAYDRYTYEMRHNKRLEQMAEMDERHAAFGQALQRVAFEALADMIPEKLTPSQTLHWLRRGVELERLAFRAPTEIVGTDVPEPRPLAEDFDDEHLKQIAEAMDIFIPPGSEEEGEGGDGDIDVEDYIDGELLDE